MKEYQTLGIVLHRRCNASCSVCCFSCSPDRLESLAEAKLSTIIKDAKRIGDVKHISLTGGEPFLTYQKLLSAVRLITKGGMNASCVTNAYWADDEDTARGYLTSLKDAGLKRLDISCDRFHQEYIPMSSVNMALKICQELDLPASLNTLHLHGESIGPIVDAIDPAIIHYNIKVSTCLPAGRARESYQSEAFPRFMDAHDLPCVYGGILTILYDGRIMPCCSQFIAETALDIGNISDMSLERAFYKIKNNGILYILRNQGLEFFRLTAKEHLKMDVPDYVTMPCELCSLFFSEDNIGKFLPYVKEEIGRLI